MGLAFAGFFGSALSAAACSNPTPLPTGYAAPCPVFSVSPASVSQSGTETLSASPQPGTDYIYTTAYYSEGSGWTLLTLTGNNAVPSYSTGPTSGSMGPSILSTLVPSTRYVVLWDWLWDATAGCYKGPGLNQCNTGTWRLQTFTLTAGTYAYSQSTYGSYTYSQSAYSTGSCTSNCFYISPSGSDTNAGTSQGVPWKTFAHAIPLLNPGATLNLMTGTYTFAANGKFFADCTTNTKNGTASAPITVQAVSERQAWIQGDGSQDSFTVNNCSYWQVIGIHASSADKNVGNTFTGYPFQFTNFQHGVVRRNIGDHNNRFGNVHVMQFVNSSNNLIEENEIYYFHRHGLIVGQGSANNEVRRNYSNERNWGAGYPTGCYPSGGTEYGITTYTANGNIFENNIGESNAGSTGVCPFNNENNASNSTYLGNIAVGPNISCGFRISSHSGQTQPTGIQYTNNVVVNPQNVGFWNRSGSATYDHDSAFGISAIGSALFLSDAGGGQTYSTYQFIVNNSTAQGASNATGYVVANTSGNTFSYDHDNSYNNGTSYNPNQNVTNPNSANPAFGSCYLWVPVSSPLKGAGSNGSDIGATILYAYQGGTLTNTKLWNTDGSFAGRGAIVPGLNDVAGSSLFDIQNRLNINKNGCAFPAGY